MTEFGHWLTDCPAAVRASHSSGKVLVTESWYCHSR
jgi:hypothetical protein